MSFVGGVVTVYFIGLVLVSSRDNPRPRRIKPQYKTKRNYYFQYRTIIFQRAHMMRPERKAADTAGLIGLDTDQPTGIGIDQGRKRRQTGQRITGIPRPLQPSETKREGAKTPDPSQGL